MFGGHHIEGATYPIILGFAAALYDRPEPRSVADSRFELRLRVVLEMASRDAEAMSMQFTRWDDMTDEERTAVAEMGRRGQTIVREQSRPVVGHGLLRPREAELSIAAAIPYRFTSNHFLRAWQIKKIRPASGSETPERTDEKYCMYDALGRSYGYTAAWVKFLIKQCSTAEGFQLATGRAAEVKAPPTSETDASAQNKNVEVSEES